MGCNARALGLNVWVEVLLTSLRHRRRWHNRGSRYLYRHINTGYVEGQCKTEYLNRFLQTALGRNATTMFVLHLQVATHLPVTEQFVPQSLPSNRFRQKRDNNVRTSSSSRNTPACNWAICSSCLSISPLATSAGDRGSSCFCFLQGMGLQMAGGCRYLIATLHAKMVGTGQSAVLPLPSKCRLQILVFSLTLIGFLILTNHLYLRTGSWGRRWNFTPWNSSLSLLLEHPGMLQIWYRGMGWSLSVRFSAL